MSSLFRNTHRSLTTDGYQGVMLGFGLAAVMGLAWVTWFLFATVPVWVVSADARLENAAQAHPLQVEAAGRIARVHVQVGDRVEQGALLLELEAPELAEQIVAAQDWHRALELRMEACGVALEAQQGSLSLADPASRAAQDEAIARVDEARASADLAAEDAQRVDRLHQGRSISDMEQLEARAEAERTAADVQALVQRPAQLAFELERETSQLVADVEELRGACAMLDSERARQQASIATLQRELERRRVRAPTSGEVVELASLPMGAYVGVGERLGALLPEGEIVLVAWFEPGSSLGRLELGQPALFRADAFPWLQHGALAARVVEVAGETRSGRLRADLVLIAPGDASFALQHGLSGTVEVEVERCSPASLVLRAAGSRLGAPVGRERP